MQNENQNQRLLWIANGSVMLFSAWFMLANLRSVMLETGAAPRASDAPLSLSRAAHFSLSGGADGPLPPVAPEVPRARIQELARAVPEPVAARLPPLPPPTQPEPVVPTPPPPPSLAPLRISPAMPARLVSAGVQSTAGGHGLELRFDRPVILRTTFQPGPRVLELTLFPVHREGLAGRLPPLAFLKSVTDVGAGRKAILRIQLQGDYLPRQPLPTGEDQSFLLEFQEGGKGPGLPPGAQLNLLSRAQVVTGLHEERYRYKPVGAEGSDVFLLEIDAASPDLSLDLAYGTSRILGKERVSSMARSLGALAAVNASFFSKNGDPLGLLAKDGHLVSMPLLSRGVLGVFDGGTQLLIGNPGFSGRVEFAGGSLDLDGVNQVRKPGKVLLYTPEWGERTGNPGGGLEVAVRNGRVESVADGDIEIPRDGYVLAVEGGDATLKLSQIGIGARLETVAGMTPPWNRVDFAVGGGPVLIRRGKVRVEWREESFSRSLVVARAPRTAVGIRQDGRLLMVVVDGRQPGVNRGLDLYEFADLMAELGCRDALNLDGGGSSTMVRDGKVQNRPSDGSERRVSTAIVIKPAPRPPMYAGGSSGLLEAAL